MKEVLDMYKYKIEDINAITRDIGEHSDSCHKESEIPAVYPKYNTAHFNNVANITSNSDSITPHKKQNGREHNIHKDHEIPLDKNEANKSITVIKTIVPNASEKLHQTQAKAFNKQRAIKFNKVGANKSKSQEIRLRIPLISNPTLTIYQYHHWTPLFGKILSTDTENWTDSNIQPTIVHLKQAAGLVHSDWNQPPTGSLNSGINVRIYG